MLNAAIVGLGRWGQRLVDSICEPGSDKIRFTRAVARTPAKVRDYCRQRNLSLGDDFASVLADASIGAIALATPHSQHADQVISAARAGKHVFVEKPFTLDSASASAAARACREAGVVLALGHNRRFLPAIVEMKRIISSGELGKVLHLEGNFSGSFGLTYPSDAWRANHAESPIGSMTAMGIHIIDAFLNLAGPVASVRCESLRRAIAIDIDDTTSVLLRFADGATGYISTLAATGRMVRVQVFGTRGWLHLIDHHLLDICDIDGRVRRIEYPQVDTERAELESFADAVAGTLAYPVPARDAVHGIAVMEAAIRSAARDGERLSVAAPAI